MQAKHKYYRGVEKNKEIIIKSAISMKGEECAQLIKMHGLAASSLARD